MDTLDFVGKTFNAPELLVPGRKPRGEFELIPGSLPRYVKGFFPLTTEGQGNLVLPNSVPDVATLERYGDSWESDGNRSTSDRIDALTDYPVILQYSFVWKNPTATNSNVVISVSAKSAGKNRLAVFYDNLGHARFYMAQGANSSTENYTLTEGERYIVEAYFGSQYTWQIRINKDLSSDINPAERAFGTVNLDFMSVLGQWYQELYYEYNSDGIEWAAVYDFAGTGISQVDMFAYCDYVSENPYRFLRTQSHVWLPGSGVVPVSSPSPRSHFYGPFRGPMRGPI